MAAPSMTCTRSSYMDPVMSNTNASDAAPTGTLSCPDTADGSDDTVSNTTTVAATTAMLRWEEDDDVEWGWWWGWGWG